MIASAVTLLSSTIHLTARRHSCFVFYSVSFPSRRHRPRAQLVLLLTSCHQARPPNGTHVVYGRPPPTSYTMPRTLHKSYMPTQSTYSHTCTSSAPSSTAFMLLSHTYRTCSATMTGNYVQDYVAAQSRQLHHCLAANLLPQEGVCYSSGSSTPPGARVGSQCLLPPSPFCVCHLL